MTKLLLVVFMVCSLAIVNAQGTKNFIDQPYIEVTGTAKMEIIPDEIYISIEIKETDSKGKQQVEQLEKKMLKTLSSVGIDTKKDLSIADFSSDFKSYWYKKSGVRNSKRYQLKVNTGKKVGQVFFELEKVGISNLSIIKTDHSKIEEYKQDVKVKAIKAAKEKAKNLAEAIGQQVGKAIYIQERNFRPYRNKQLANFAFETKSSIVQSDMPEMDFEKIMLEYEIFVKFVLE